MNQILLFPEDYISDSRVILKERRFQHLLSIIKIKTGDRLKAGIINGMRGDAVVVEKGSDFAILETSLTEPPPPAIPLTLVIAMPRPKSLRKAVHYAAAMGVKKIFIIRHIENKRQKMRIFFLIVYFYLLIFHYLSR